ncbi:MULTISPECIES: YafY family protein [unclassified Fusibacter]|uniref:helix-turn-helix transcriptional regulator n=1 Tax=unclassified Fusibacter TaxID=2624464 RepID=UPI001010C6D8|nr:MULTISPECIES: YafY family protein [unclassified Fusibacter]MCK8059249.1 YafY family transcriptional regulator [Fusibacter sp. A2]NPE21287.1 YafY family transcriptional regulator [Fusibacter sp. A1]RXV62552.1 YafY family transcriptional regulator [Fusibacter sp. A1]
MKLQRLLRIVTYLLNKEFATAKVLAERFEVSERTIQRDIESINMAGIPVVSLRGVKGGYQLLDTFRLSRQVADQQDLQVMRMALESAMSAWENKKLKGAYEKIGSLTSTSAHPVKLDFSSANENPKITTLLTGIEDAIRSEKQLAVTYVNADHGSSEKRLEPIYLAYQWYSWYLVAFDTQKQVYRTYKVARITELKVTGSSFSNHHPDHAQIRSLVSQEELKTVEVEIKYADKIAVSVDEYLMPMDVKRVDEETLCAKLHIIPKERLWKGILLSFGSDLEVVEPQEIRTLLEEHTRKIMTIYSKHDS